MTTPTNRGSRPIGLIVAIALVQVFDIIIHVATDQMEPIRIASNLIILAWLGLMAGGRDVARSVTAGAVGGYLLLNLLFLAQEGITNPAQGGAVRVVLLVLVLVTVVGSGLLTLRRSKR